MKEWSTCEGHLARARGADTSCGLAGWLRARRGLGAGPRARAWRGLARARGLGAGPRPLRIARGLVLGYFYIYHFRGHLSTKLRTTSKPVWPELSSYGICMCPSVSAHMYIYKCFDTSAHVYLDTCTYTSAHSDTCALRICNSRSICTSAHTHLCSTTGSDTLPLKLSR